MEETNVESAGFGIRAAGRLIDYAPMFFASVMSGVSLAFFAGLFSTWSRRSESDILAIMEKSSALTYAGSFLAITIYHAFCECAGGASLGKRLLGLEVVSVELVPATFGQTFKRNLGFAIDGLFFGLIGYGQMEQSPIKQRYGDRWGKTRVVLRRSLPPALRPPKRIFVFVFLGAVALALEVVTVMHLVSYWLRTL